MLSSSETGLCSADIVMDVTLGYAQENGGPQCQQPVSSSDERDDNPDPDRTDGGDDDFDGMGLSMGGFVGVVVISILFGGLLAGMLLKYTSMADMCPGMLGMKGTDYETYKSRQAALSPSQGEYGSNSTLTSEASNPIYATSPSGSRRSEL